MPQLKVSFMFCRVSARGSARMNSFCVGGAVVLPFCSHCSLVLFFIASPSGACTSDFCPSRLVVPAERSPLSP
jgi:hypothetical protein